MNKKSTGSFSKIRTLITVLQKCNGKAFIGDDNALISPKAAKVLVYCSLLTLTGILSLGVYFVHPYIAWFISIKGLTQALMLLLLILSFVLAIKDIVVVLYTADDLALLLPMPFSASQIVWAKLAVVSAVPLILSFIILNSVCLGFGIREGIGASFIIGTVLSSILIPVTGIFAAALLVVIVFRIFGFIRNRDIIVGLGGIFTFGFTIAYIYFSNHFGSEGSGNATAALHAFSSVSAAFPNIFFMNRFMFEESIPGLLFSLAATAAVIVLAMLAVKAFYFNTALSMHNTGSRKKAVSEASLRRVRKSDVLMALTAYEAKSSRRNPAYMIYGFAMSFLWPVLFALPFVFGNHSLFSSIVFPLDTVPALISSVSFAMTASCFSCGFNILPGTAFSREGSNFCVIRALPVDLENYYKSKRNFSTLICSLGSVLYVVILGIACIAAGAISIGNSWTILAGACVSFLLNLTFINILLLTDSRKPRFDWDSDTEFSRKLGVINVIIIAIGVFMLMAFIAGLIVIPYLDDPKTIRIILIICTAVVPAILLLGLTVNRFAVKAGVKNLMKLE